MPTDINVSQLIINKLTRAQYKAAEAAGTISDSELYFITDDTDADIVAASSSDGVTYTATVPNMPEFVVGKEIVIIPDRQSASTNPTLNVNGLGAKYLRCRLTTNNSATTTGYSANWILASKPLKVMWNGTYWVTDIFRPDVNTLYGTIKSESVSYTNTDSGMTATNVQDAIDELASDVDENKEQIAEATSSDGVTYTVTVPGITELTKGVKFTMIPGMTSTSDSVEINVNGLGALPLKARRLMNSGSSITALSDDWLNGDYPITVMYNGYWWVTTDFGYAHASYLYGTVPVNGGGTGKVNLTAGSYLVGNGTGNVQLKTPSEVLTDIGGAPAYTYGTTDMTAGTSALETGKLYFVYE